MNKTIISNSWLLGSGMNLGFTLSTATSISLIFWYSWLCNKLFSFLIIHIIIVLFCYTYAYIYFSFSLCLSHFLTRNV